MRECGVKWSVGRLVMSEVLGCRYACCRGRGRMGRAGAGLYTERAALWSAAFVGD